MSDDHWVYVVDDDQAMRESLQWLIESVGMQVQTFDSADAFLKACKPDWSGCLLLDVRMPGMSGLELQSYLGRRSICLPVIVITGHGDVAMAVRAMKAGALDFIEKPFDDEALLGSIRKALENDDRARLLRAEQANILARMKELTPREREVMDLVTDGQSNREIATALSVSAKTVEVHRSRVMDKMHADSLAELVRMVIMANTP
ncbi:MULTISPECIES: response regulator FixJ [Thiorhodovibrio]|uniref:response regulator FixJ n=1 Tax=Thiorhodovibrio TaxID=61593 RepID=UPI001912CADA|nr:MULTISPECIES: response regulator FixJ [Thiorhodovibrio]MBK5968137.1 DNA-binding response regulator [Thiorhodovibrio winogradskyi]WPL13645.1 Transcriptional regulatory protein FixJ [Thiorhodovibrio litoralis]